MDSFAIKRLLAFIVLIILVLIVLKLILGIIGLLVPFAIVIIAGYIIYSYFIKGR